MMRRPGTGNETLDQEAARDAGASIKPALIYVVDDDPSVRRSLERFASALGFDVQAFATGGSVLRAVSAERPGCVLLDVRLPDMNGLAVQEQLASRAPGLVVIPVSGCGDIPMSVRAMKAGAADFLTKPVDGQYLALALTAAIEQSRLLHRRELEAAGTRERYAHLTRRQRQVMGLVTQGLLNKQIADRLGISEKTVKAHRHEVMMKMGVRTVAELVPLAQTAAPAKPAMVSSTPDASRGDNAR